jgi:aclacinomycin oxidase
MSRDISRRCLLAGAAILSAGAPSLLASTPAVAGQQPATAIWPVDPRYADLAIRRINARFDVRPRSFRLPSSTGEVVRAVADAVSNGQRISVRSGGHCYENFVGDPAPDVVLDLAGMNDISYDPRLRAFAIQPGALLGDIYQTLYFRWGVTIPGGQCPTVAAGGHFSGGGYGPLSRLLGSVVDYLYAVEVVVVDRAGRVRPVVATREQSDPHRDLWWAHTGGGGGNFGVVTRYWMRTPDVTGSAPTRLLPRPPASMRRGFALWSWHGMTAEAFRRLLRNHADWHEANSAPGGAYDSMSSVLQINRVGGPVDIQLAVQLDGSRPDAAKLVGSFLAAVAAGVSPLVSQVEASTVPWLAAMRSGESGTDVPSRQKNKAAYLRRGFLDRQIDDIYQQLSTAGPHGTTGALWLASYGGQVNAVAPTATAMPQRDSIMKAIFVSTWTDPALDTSQLTWMRTFYRKVYQDTGGVPAPNEINDGSYINYADVDLADPTLNTSGLPWHTLYYKENYPRLRKAKADWDPRDVFHHALAIRA